MLIPRIKPMNKTEKLYYIDAYIKEFDALVISSVACEGGYDTVLDKTAFFPEEGGQYSDKGYIDGVFVFDVREKDGIIHHYSKESINVNKTAHCSINFEERFDKMQQHTAEHMISGFLHKLYGIENTGFHLGAVDVTLDTSKQVSREQMAEIERLVNLAVCRNIKIETSFPKSEELPSLDYRSKLDLTENVRIVDIGDVDSCACCAPHVSFTGEIGMVKLVDSVKRKDGSRIRMLAGKRAYDYVAKITEEASAVSVMLSAPVTDISTEVEKLLNAKCALDSRLCAMGKEMAELFAASFPGTEKNAVFYYPSLDAEAMRTFVNACAPKVKGTLVALSGEEGDYKYVLYNATDDFSSVVKNANAALLGRGGGKPPMASGSYKTSLLDIKKYFEF